ncbi:MAG: cyclic nucleotide-binding domain-containing protein [Candidatus Dormibacteria bacterium]
MRARLVVTATALADTMRNPALRRVQLSFASVWTSEWALTVAVGVIAFNDGGAALVGIIAALRMAVPALVSPFSSALADQLRRDRLLFWAGLVRSAATALAALLLAFHGPEVAMYALLILAACAFIVVRAAGTALVPLLCNSPQELTSAMATRGLFDSTSTLVGPLLAALLLGLSTPAVVVAVAALLSAVSSALLTGLAYDAPARVGSTFSLKHLAVEEAEGLAAIRRNADAGVLIALALVQTFVRGGLTVFLVVLAFTVLHTGDAGVGLLTAALGAGATVGSVAAFSLVMGHRLALVEGLGVALWGLPLMASAGVTSGLALALLIGVIGVGNALADVGGFTLMARLVPEELLGRLFGTFESLIALTVALGSLVAPLLIDHLGLRAALLIVGVVAPVAALLATPRLLRVDRSVRRLDDEIGVLRRVAMLQPLPLPVIEHLAEHVGHLHVAEGTDVFREGDAGDYLYVIERGTADVFRDGRMVLHLDEGECFGEVALLRSIPRTATVRAHAELDLQTVGRAEFLLAVAGSAATGREAQHLLHERLKVIAPVMNAEDA